MAKAQENYYILNNQYTLSKTNLQNQSGWFAEGTLLVNILAAGSQSFSATAQHQSSGNVFTYSSSAGGLQ